MLTVSKCGTRLRLFRACFLVLPPPLFSPPPALVPSPSLPLPQCIELCLSGLLAKSEVTWCSFIELSERHILSCPSTFRELGRVPRTVIQTGGRYWLAAWRGGMEREAVPVNSSQSVSQSVGPRRRTKKSLSSYMRAFVCGVCGGGGGGRRLAPPPTFAWRARSSLLISLPRSRILDSGSSLARHPPAQRRESARTPGRPLHAPQEMRNKISSGRLKLSQIQSTSFDVLNINSGAGACPPEN